MNNSMSHPHDPRPVRVRVENRVAPSTSRWTPKSGVNRGFVRSSTIHTPYYHYSRDSNTRNIRRRGTNCAYPS